VTETCDGVTTTRYLWCGDAICQDRDVNDNVLRRDLNEGEYNVGTGQKLIYMPDQLGSVRDVLDGTTVALVAATDFTPYGGVGQTYGTTTTDYRYAGLFYHVDSGLNLSATRPQDGVTGRWLGRDPIGELAGPNLYAYVGANPVVLLDPYGLYDINDFEIDALQGWAGFGDAITFGGTRWARQALNRDYADPCSTAYRIGDWAGIGAGVAEAGAGLLRGGLRIELGNWKQASQWMAPKGQKILHFHWGVGPGLQSKHLPYQIGDWWQNFQSLLGRGLAGPDLVNMGLVGGGAATATGGATQNCGCKH